MHFDRQPAVAGRFYPGTREDCWRFLAENLTPCERLGAVGAVAPHAGWCYSGAVAGKAVAALGGREAETVVIFGAVHVRDRNRASVYPCGRWFTPLGETQVDTDLAAGVSDSGSATPDIAAHAREHSIEVLLPFVQALFPAAMLLPIMVRPGDWSAGAGRAVAAEAARLGRRIAVIASTDLTHYGPMFGFEPAGRGEEGVRWAKDVNDRRFIERIAAMDAVGLVAEAEQHSNACGAGAVAASIAAAAELAATSYRELEHLSSAEVIGEAHPVASVGYHAGAFLS